MAKDRLKRIPEAYTTFSGGVSTAFDPDLVNTSQLAWAKNMDLRGGKAQTRGGFVERIRLPRGRVQGIGYFSGAGSQLLLSIDGFLHRVQFGRDEFTRAQIDVPQPRSPAKEEVFMTETSGFMVIQDGESKALIYDGSSMRNATDTEVPKGKQMAYGNGRLWVALPGGRLQAGDITGVSTGSELNFTENIYLLGGGSFVMPSEIVGMAFMPSNDGATGFGPLTVWGVNYTVAMRADIAERNEWSNVPGFQSTLFPDLGGAGHHSIMTDNQDLIYRDNEGQLRNLRQAIAEYGSAGSASISREVSRITENESADMLQFAYSASFKDRMFAAGGPRFIYRDIIAYRDIISMDFAPTASLAGKSSAIYNGEWEGFDSTQIIKVVQDGIERIFFVSKDTEGENRLWEYRPEEPCDISLDPFSDPVTILSVSSITSTTTTATATTTQPHGYTTGDFVDVRGTDTLTFAGCVQVLSTPTTTTFTYAILDNGSLPAKGDTITVQTGQVLRVKNEIVQEMIFRKVNFNSADQAKRIESFNVWVSEYNNLDVTVYFRPDEEEQWTLWGSWDTRCINIVDPINNVTPHIWKELRRGQEPEVIPFTYENIDDSVIGHDFQVKLRITGKVKIDRAVLYAQLLPTQEVYAKEISSACVDNEITVVELFYEIPVFNPVVGNYVDESADGYVDELVEAYEGT